MILFILWNVGYILKGVIEIKTEVELSNDLDERGYLIDLPSVINLRKELKKEICDNKVLSILLPFIPALKTDNYYIKNVDNVIKKFEMRGLLGTNNFNEIERITKDFLESFDKELEKAKLDDKVTTDIEVLDNNEENSSLFIKYDIEVGKNKFGKTDEYIVTDVLTGQCNEEYFKVCYGINKEGRLDVISATGEISLFSKEEQEGKLCEILVEQYELMKLLFENDKEIYDYLISQTNVDNNHELKQSIRFYVKWLSELHNKNMDKPKVFEYKN